MMIPAPEPASPARMHIFNPELRDFGGHFFEYLHAVRSGLLEKGVKVTIYGHANLVPAVREKLGALPLPHMPGEGFRNVSVIGSVPYFFTSNAILFFTLCRLHLKKFCRNDVIFFPEIDFCNCFIGPALWAGLIPFFSGKRKVHPVFLLRLPPDDRTNKRGRLKRLHHRVAFWLSRKHVRFVSDSREIAAAYEQRFGVPFVTVPIPHSPASMKRSRSPRLSTCVFLGEARREKGFHLLADIVGKAAARHPSLQFLLQSYASPVNPALCISSDTLAIYGPERVTLFPQSLPAAAYEKLLYDADLLLLPYDAKTYRMRTSGPFSEALAAGIPVLVTDGTWMAGEMMRCGLPKELCPEQTAEAFAQAITFAASHYADILARFQEAAVRWRAWHNPHSYAELLLGNRPSTLTKGGGT